MPGRADFDPLALPGDADEASLAAQLDNLRQKERAIEAERQRLKARLTQALESRGPRTLAPPLPLGLLAGAMAGLGVLLVLRALGIGGAP